MKLVLLLFAIFVSSISYAQNELVFYPKSKATSAQKEAAKPLGALNYGMCNAFLVTKDIVMTNEHCVTGSNYNLRDLSITFNLNESDQETYYCGEVLYKNKKLDMALLRAHGIPKKKYGRVVFANKRLKMGDSILIINYNHDNPNRLGKIYQIFSEGPVLGSEDPRYNRIVYKALTQPGSSGSAVFHKNSKDGRYYFVGLHNVGYGDTFKDGYKGGISADLIYDKIISLDNSDAHNIVIEGGKNAWGRTIEYHKNGKIKSIGYTWKGGEDVFLDNKNGRKLGKWNYYFKDGTLRSKEVYNLYTGFKSGEWVRYYPNGEIALITNYASQLTTEQRFEFLSEFGMKHGNTVAYYSNEKRRYSGQYTHGKKSGQWYYYKSDGTYYKTLNYDGEVNVKNWVEYNSKGGVRGTGELRNGKKHGSWKIYAKDIYGKKRIYVGEFRSDKKYGVWDVFDDKGSMLFREKYDSQGKMIDDVEEFTLYYPKSKRVYKECSIFTNKCRYFHKSGKLFLEQFFSDRGKEEAYLNAYDIEGNQILKNGFGFVDFYVIFGTRSERFEVKNGVKEGTSTTYDPDGNIVSKSEYKKGKKVK